MPTKPLSTNSLRRGAIAHTTILQMVTVFVNPKASTKSLTGMSNTNFTKLTNRLPRGFIFVDGHQGVLHRLAA